MLTVKGAPWQSLDDAVVERYMPEPDQRQKVTRSRGGCLRDNSLNLAHIGRTI
jgi:hypothetical protein